MKYLIVDSQKLIDLLTSFLCKECHNSSLEVRLDPPKAFVALLVYYVQAVEPITHSRLWVESRLKSQRPAFDVNRTVVKAFSAMGKGHKALEVFCMAMNIKPIPFCGLQLTHSSS